MEPARRVPDVGERLAAVEGIAGVVEDLLEAAVHQRGDHRPGGGRRPLGHNRAGSDLQLDVVDAAAAIIAVARLRGGVGDPQVPARILCRGGVGDDRPAIRELVGPQWRARRRGKCRPADEVARQRRHHFVAGVAVATEDVGRERVGLARLHPAEVLGDGAGAVVAADRPAIGGQTHVAVIGQASAVDGVEVAGRSRRGRRSGVPGGARVQKVVPAHRASNVGVPIGVDARVDRLEARVDEGRLRDEAVAGEHRPRFEHFPVARAGRVPQSPPTGAVKGAGMQPVSHEGGVEALTDPGRPVDTHVNSSSRPRGAEKASRCCSGGTAEGFRGLLPDPKGVGSAN